MDAELVTLSVLQALLGFPSEARWLRYARAHLRGWFPYLPKQPGYNKRLRRRRDHPLGHRRGALAGWAEYGYCASQSRSFRGLRLLLLCTLHGLPVRFALTGAKTDERQVPLGILDTDPDLATHLPGQVLGDKNQTAATSKPGSPKPADPVSAHAQR